MQELQIVLEKDTGKHYYEQIYSFISSAVRQGSLRKGERLPSTRVLADYLGVSRSTVQLAYEQLLAEGYIRGKRGSGYYVSDLEDILRIPEPSEAQGQSLQAPESGRKPEEPAREASASGQIDFSPRMIEMKQFPLATWKKIHKGIFAGENAGLFAAGDAAGEPALRETIARYLQLSRGVRCTPEQVVVGAGTDYLLLLLGQILARRSRVGMESPTYLRAARIFRSFGWEVAGIPMDQQGMRADALEETGCDTAYVMPAHQFPTGVLMPVARRMQLLRWAERDPGRYLIEDDYDSEFRYRGKPIPALQSLDRSGKVVYIGTFSKAIAPAIRVSYMILPPALLKQYRERCFFFSSTVSRIDQAILNTFMAEGYFERYLNRMRTLYRGRHDILIQELKALAPDFSVSGTGAGHHVMLLEQRTLSAETIPEREEDLREKALAEGVLVYPVSAFRLPWAPWPAGQERKAGVVLGYGGLSGEQIRTGIGKLRKAWLS